MSLWEKSPTEGVFEQKMSYFCLQSTPRSELVKYLQVVLFTKQKWCAGGGPLSKINSKDVLTMAYLKGKKIPLEELTEFTKESRFFVLKNKNYLRKMENNLEQFGFEQRVMPVDKQKVCLNECVSFFFFTSADKPALCVLKILHVFVRGK